MFNPKHGIKKKIQIKNKFIGLKKKLSPYIIHLRTPCSTRARTSSILCLQTYTFELNYKILNF